MSRINVLDDVTSNKIAAGEVVERPSSVVKELIENSIDANAKNIQIEIKDGGSTLIRIIDDGDGIHKDDLKKAFLPHATSKIKNVEDIFSILSLGFRGEALASIASVAKVNLKSKTADSEFGRGIVVEGGKILSEEECGCNDGTQIDVTDLFYNVPARKKFLKSFTREGSIINDIVNRIAISNPKISFLLINNDKKVLQTYGNGNQKDVIRAIYGKTISDETIPFKSDNDFISISGFIGRELIARGSRNNQSIFVNNRYIKNKTVVAAVENAFKSFSTVNKFPFFVLNINIYPEFIDVNIHPTKSEIKFKDERVLFKTVFDAIHTALKNDVFNDFNLPEEIKQTTQTLSEKPIELELNFLEEASKIKQNSNISSNEFMFDKIDKEREQLLKLKNAFSNESVMNNKIDFNQNEDSYSESLVKEDNSNSYTDKDCVSKEDLIPKFPALNVIGQFNKTYILCENDSILYIIDQHAAHEKILFENYMQSIKNKNIVVQPMLIPTLIDLSQDDFAYFEENKSIFLDSGFVIENFGDFTISIKEVPYFLGKLDAKKIFIDILDNIKNLGSGKEIEVKYNKIATMACKSAVKGNDYLDYKEMVNLVDKLRFIEDPFHCPHGRPTIIKFSSTDLDKKFRRIV